MTKGEHYDELVRQRIRASLEHAETVARKGEDSPEAQASLERYKVAVRECDTVQFGDWRKAKECRGHSELA